MSWMLLIGVCSALGVAASVGITHVINNFFANTTAQWPVSVSIPAGLLAVAFFAVALFGVKQLPTYFATWVWAIGILAGYAACIRGVMLKIRLAVPLLVALLEAGLARAKKSKRHVFVYLSAPW